jgi:hypothetical protein
MDELSLFNKYKVKDDKFQLRMEIKPETFLKNKSLLSLESDFDTVFIPGSFCIQQSNFVLSCIVC